MHKSSLILGFLILSGSYSDRVSGQSKSPGTQSLTQINQPTNSSSDSSTGLATATERETEAKERYLKGTTLAASGQFSEAVENLEQAIKLDPGYADAYSALGRAYFKLQQWQKAADSLHRATELHTKQRASQVAQRPKLVDKREDPSTSKRSVTANSQTQLPQTNANELKSLNASAAAPPTSQPAIGSAPLQSGSTSLVLKTSQPTNKNVIALTSATPKTQTPPEANHLRVASVPANAVPTIEPIKQPTANAKSPGNPPATTRAQKNELSTVAKLAPSTPQIKRPAEINFYATGIRADAKAIPPSEPSVASATPFKNGDTTGLDTTPSPVAVRVAMSEPPSMPAEMKDVSSLPPTRSDDVSLTKIYRVGPNDVLDIRLNDPQSSQSTLFTITPSGFLEHPMLTEPLPVNGLTVDEIGAKIENDLKKRALIDDPKVVVGVRDFASHSILVSGLVKDSGTRFLRREAIPLYVVVADAQPLPEAATVTVVRNEASKVYEIDLTQPADMNLLVHPGDVVTLRPNAMQFIYIGGEVKNPGEKTFRRGLTLMQAIVGAGGVTPKSKEAEIGRDDGSGFLVAVRYRLKDIQSGKTVDPLLKPGDRVMLR